MLQSTNLKALFRPVQLGPLTLINRVGLSPMTRSRSVPTNVPNDINVEYYRQRAAGGAGIIITEGTLITGQGLILLFIGTEWPNAPGIWSDEQVEGWKKVTTAVHAEGGKIFSQLWHLGRLSHPDAPEQKKAGVPVYGPSAIAAKQEKKFRFIYGEPSYVTPTAIEDPATLLPIWKKAAANAKAADFDGVEAHGATGYLINQFLDSSSDQRTDNWGGSIENRSRFGLEVLKVLGEVWGPERVGIKVSPTGGFNDVGMPLEENIATYSHFISEADKMKLAYICLMRYSEMMDPVIDGISRATKHDVLDTYLPLIKNSSKWANSGFTAEEADKLISEGKVDGVFFGMPWIANPDLAKRFEHGKALNQNIDFGGLYGRGGDMESEKKGYTDYPTAD